MPSDAPNEAVAQPAAAISVRRASLTLRTVFVTTLVALLAVLMTGLTALPLLRMRNCARSAPTVVAAGRRRGSVHADDGSADRRDPAAPHQHFAQ